MNRQLPHLSDTGQGVNRQLPHLSDTGQGEDEPPFVTSRTHQLRAYFHQLAERIRNMRVCCGDWTRVCGPTPTVKLGLTALFFDPPYGVADRDSVYGEHESRDVAADVRAYCLEHGNDPLLRICLCGYAGEHDELERAGWATLVWKTQGGYANQESRGSENGKREKCWFSPHCLHQMNQQTLLL